MRSIANLGVTWTRECLPWALTVTVLSGCGGVSELATNKDASTFAIDSASEKNMTEMDGAVVPDPGDSSGEATRPEDSSAQPTDVCAHTCPMSEPAVGDSCDFGLRCEYGGSPLLSCNRVYDCFSGHIALDPSLVQDASACAMALSPGCPASRTVVAPGESCGTTPLECLYANDECDCIAPGNGTATWVCSGIDGGGSEGCPVPRAMLGTPCSPDLSGPEYCQNIAPCVYEACSSCGNQWSTFQVPCGNGMIPLRDGGG